ncbi:MAG: hypothetical protein F4X64_01815 [Chloroflexi bacterium]|nr:hypothetical protein [Chloroflexota bacterium]
MTNEEKAQALLSSPAGCSFVLDASENLHLGIDRIAEPDASFWLASSAMDWCDVHAGAGWRERRSMTLDSARDFADLALEIMSSPQFAWWYEPLDLGNQVWTSPQMIRGSLPADPALTEPFRPERWRRPSPPDQDADPVPDTSVQGTSTLRGSATSEVAAYAIYAADHICAFPLAAWRVQFEQEVRVFEINHPADWHELCLEFPHCAPDGRLVPDWRAASEQWDGVHLTLGGALSCEQARYEADGQWSMMQFWHTEETRWLNRIAATGERVPDFQRQPHDLSGRLRRFPYGFKPGK